MKKYFTAVENYAANPTEEQKQQVEQRMSEAYSKIDKAIKRGVIHRNNGSRKKASLAKSFKARVKTAV